MLRDHSDSFCRQKTLKRALPHLASVYPLGPKAPKEDHRAKQVGSAARVLEGEKDAEESDARAEDQHGKSFGPAAQSDDRRGEIFGPPALGHVCGEIAPGPAGPSHERV